MILELCMLVYGFDLDSFTSNLTRFIFVKFCIIAKLAFTFTVTVTVTFILFKLFAICYSLLSCLNFDFSFFF